MILKKLMLQTTVLRCERVDDHDNSMDLQARNQKAEQMGFKGFGRTLYFG